MLLRSVFNSFDLIRKSRKYEVLLFMLNKLICGKNDNNQWKRILQQEIKHCVTKRDAFIVVDTDMNVFLNTYEDVEKNGYHIYPVNIQSATMGINLHQLGYHDRVYELCSYVIKVNDTYQRFEEVLKDEKFAIYIFINDSENDTMNINRTIYFLSLLMKSVKRHFEYPNQIHVMLSNIDRYASIFSHKEMELKELSCYHVSITLMISELDMIQDMFYEDFKNYIKMFDQHVILGNCIGIQTLRYFQDKIERYDKKIKKYLNVALLHKNTVLICFEHTFRCVICEIYIRKMKKYEKKYQKIV